MIDLPLDVVARIVGAREPHPSAGVVTGPVVTGPVVTDSREVTPGALFAAIVGERSDGHDHVASAAAAGAVAVLGSRDVPGAPVPVLVVPDVVDALSALAHHVVEALRPELTVVALTGSQGKTSVKDLLRTVLATAGPVVAPVGSFNNELGVPLTILRADASTRHLVVEMGARGIGHVAHLCRIARPDVSLVLNVGTAHVGEFGSVDAIAQGKGEIVEALDASGVAILNADDHRVAAMAERTAGRVVTFGTSGDVRVGDVTLDATGHPHFALRFASGESRDVTVPQLGRHHASNAAAAAAAAEALGLAPADIVAALATAVPGSPMRMEPVPLATGALVINDAYNANPESMTAALQTLADIAGERAVAVLGPMRELGDGSEAAHRRIGELALGLGIGRVVVIGDEALPIARAAGDIAVWVPDVESAVTQVKSSLQPDSVVLVKASRGARLERVVAALAAEDLNGEER